MTAGEITPRTQTAIQYMTNMNRAISTICQKISVMMGARKRSLLAVHYEYRNKPGKRDSQIS